MEDKLIGAQGPTAGSIAGSTSPALGSVVSCEPTSTPSPTVISLEKLFQQFMKTYATSIKILEQNQGAQTEPRKKPLKANVPDVYYGKLHMDCYHFCQRCEDHFETVWGTGANRILFAASFLRENISVCWV